MALPDLTFISYVPPALLGTSEESGSTPEPPPKCGRGQPKGSENKVKDQSSTQPVSAAAAAPIPTLTPVNSHLGQGTAQCNVVAQTALHSHPGATQHNIAQMAPPLHPPPDSASQRADAATAAGASSTSRARSVIDRARVQQNAVPDAVSVLLPLSASNTLDTSPLGFITDLENQNDFTSFVSGGLGNENDEDGDTDPNKNASGSQPRVPFPDWFQKRVNTLLDELKDDLKSSTLKGTTLKPTDLFTPDFFVWDPLNLLGKTHRLRCPTPNCNHHLTRSGVVNRPRRVVDVDSTFWLIGYTYECQKTATGGCDARFRSWDERVLQRLPRALAAEFPAHLTWRSGLSTRAFGVVRSCFQHGMGSEEVADMFRMQHLRRYDELRLQYLRTKINQMGFSNTTATSICEDIPVNGHIAIGFDSEWNVDVAPHGRLSGQGPPATAQVAYKDRVHVLRIGEILLRKVLPAELVNLLHSEQVIKAGRKVNGDLQRLAVAAGYPPNHFRGALDLAAFAKDRFLITKATLSLADIFAAILHQCLPKNDTERVSRNWSDQELSDAQLEYAARDAYVSLLLYHEINKTTLPLPLPTTAKTPCGTPVLLITDDNRKLAAQGVISAAASEHQFNGENITKTRTVITVQDILLPGAIIGQNKERGTGRKLSLEDFGKPPFDILAHRSHVRIKPITSTTRPDDSPMPNTPEPEPNIQPPFDFGPPLDEHGVEMISVAEGLNIADSDDSVPDANAELSQEQDAASATEGETILGPAVLHVYAWLIRSRVLKDAFHVGYFNSTGQKFQGHNCIWLLNEIHELEIMLGEHYDCLPAQLAWVNGNIYKKTEQSAGIIQIPKSVRELVKIQPYNEETDSEQKQAYLAKMQGTRMPVLPVHTLAEKQLFAELIRTSPTFQRCSTSVSLPTVEIWNQKAETTKDIYYKLEEQLNTYLNGPFKDSANIRQSCAQARGRTEPLHHSLQDPQRTSKIVNATSGPLVPHQVTTGFEKSVNSAEGSGQVQFHQFSSSTKLKFFSSMPSTISASKVVQFAKTQHVPLAAARSTIEINQKRSAEGEPAGQPPHKQPKTLDGSTGIDAPTLAGIAISAEFCSVLVALQRSQMFEDVFQRKIWTRMISQRLHEQRWVWGK
ncbi:hypothetical protein B0H17DRAFT_1135117 [Mycena rosella]|uniref:3'-5' exonuclease n=1 Tax=Mycena rosella TaxID=1033263 RepID=A0AAD7DDV7_MYCRO|nr:hypothetical protein B0H17DRAFT_1135117 [Mycena rosella]